MTKAVAVLTFDEVKTEQVGREGRSASKLAPRPSPRTLCPELVMTLGKKKVRIYANSADT